MASDSWGDDRHHRALERVIFLSDGVFAIAMTLLALELRLPEIPDRTSAALGEALAENVPHFIAFFISFEVIGIFWLAHQRLFSVIARFDRVLALLNLLFLMSIALMPFSTTLVAEYPRLTASAVFYSGSLVLTSLASNAIWLYAARGGRLLEPGVSRLDVRVTTARGVVTLALFVVSFGVAFFSVTAARVTWVLVAVAAPLAERWARRRGGR